MEYIDPICEAIGVHYVEELRMECLHSSFIYKLPGPIKHILDMSASQSQDWIQSRTTTKAR